MRFEIPAQYLAGLAGRQEAAHHEPSVLRDYAAVKEHQLLIGSDLYHSFRSIRRHHQFVSGLERQRADETPRTPVIGSAVALVLHHLLRIRKSAGRGSRIFRETVEASVHGICLAPVLGRQELQVEAGLALEECRYRLVQIDRDFHTFALRAHHYAGVEVIAVIAQAHLYGTGSPVHLPERSLGNQVPLFRCAGKAYSSALRRPDAVVDELYARVLFVIEAARKQVAVDKQVHSPGFIILQVVDLEILCRR